MDEDYLDDLEFDVHECARSHFEIPKLDLLDLIELAREALKIRNKLDEQ